MEKNPKTANLGEVFAVIAVERKYQDSLGKYRTNEPEHSVGDELTMLGTYLRKAEDAYTNNPGVEMALHEIRKLAAIAVRCMETHGAPKRITPKINPKYALTKEEFIKSNEELIRAIEKFEEENQVSKKGKT